MRILVAIVLLSATVTGWSQPWIAAAQHRIVATEVFSFGGVGFALATSEGETDFKMVMSLPSLRAIEAFEQIYTTGNPQAKSYALAGLRKLDKARFGELRKAALSSEEMVKTAHGCVISSEPLRKVVIDIDSGEYDSQAR